MNDWPVRLTMLRPGGVWWFVPAAVAFFAAGIAVWRLRRAAASFAASARPAELVRPWVNFGGWTLLIVAACDPRLPSEAETAPDRVSTMIVLDRSRSMTAGDRPQVAAALVDELAATLPGRVGRTDVATTFARFAPLTARRDAITDGLPFARLSAASVERIGDGSHLSLGLFDADTAFRDETTFDGTVEIVVLVSDGENHDDRLSDAVRTLSENGRTIVAFVAGKPGVPQTIPTPNGPFRWEGAIVETTASTDAFERSGIMSVELVESVDAAKPAVEQFVRDIIPRELRMQAASRSRPLARPIAAVALVVLLFGQAWSRAELGFARRGSTAFVLAGCVLLSGSERSQPSFGECLRLFEAGQRVEAAKAFERVAARDRSAVASYNAGCAWADAARMGRSDAEPALRRAIRNFTVAIRRDPSSDDARANLELAHHLLRNLEASDDATSREATQDGGSQAAGRPGSRQSEPSEQADAPERDDGERSDAERGDSEQGDERTGGEPDSANAAGADQQPQQDGDDRQGGPEASPSGAPPANVGSLDKARGGDVLPAAKPW